MKDTPMLDRMRHTARILNRQSMHETYIYTKWCVNPNLHDKRSQLRDLFLLLGNNLFPPEISSSGFIFFDLSVSSVIQPTVPLMQIDIAYSGTYIKTVVGNLI